jgi:gamma-glutamylcysteine synthetase
MAVRGAGLQQARAARAGRVGLELEMATARLGSLDSHPVGPFFERLALRKQRRGLAATVKSTGGRSIGVASGPVFSSIDNGFNNLESAFGPIGGPSPLNGLADMAAAELDDVLAALAEEGATFLNLSQHPLVAPDEAFYRAVRAPKPIYDYWVHHRGWDHRVGIDAKAQNGPNIDIAFSEAVRALNLALALAPALIALFANSPFEAGRVTGLKETRLTIWDRMFAEAHLPGDRRQHRLPEEPFRDLRHYLDWMLGEGTAMQIVPLRPGLDYKGMAEVARVEGDPPALAFLRGGPRRGLALSTGAAVEVAPVPEHLEFLQFSHFLDARIRWRFGLAPDLSRFSQAYAREGGLEELFAAHAVGCYIECRAAGANFPDFELVREAPEAAASVVMAPTAVMAGLIRNLEGSERIVRRWGWRGLRSLRAAAVRDAFAGEADTLSLAALCREVLEAAEDGLAADERWLLAYPRHVIATGACGADRALAALQRAGGDERARIAAVTASRIALPPELWHRRPIAPPRAALG